MSTEPDLSRLHGLTPRHVTLLLATPGDRLALMSTGELKKVMNEQTLIGDLVSRGLIVFWPHDGSYCRSGWGKDAAASFLQAAMKLGWSGKGKPSAQVVTLLLGAPR